MTTHILSMTYQPKIEGVRNGTIGQTIRMRDFEKQKEVGDRLILHGWSGPPYRSKWNWRLETKISELLILRSHYEWFGPLENRHHMTVWKLYTGFEILPSGHHYSHYRVLETEEVEDIIRRDGIAPVEYTELEKVLEKLNGIGSTDQEWWDVIRWPTGDSGHKVPNAWYSTRTEAITEQQLVPEVNQNGS